MYIVDFIHFFVGAFIGSSAMAAIIMLSPVLSASLIVMHLLTII